jgi:DNA-(apurinic or apyrimidinic site) lyase
MYIVDRGRASYIGKLVKSISDFIDLLEENDPQYKAVAELINNIGSGNAVVVIIANALISYQLSSKGEDYWRGLAEWFSKYRGVNIDNLEKLYMMHSSFIENTKYNRMGLAAKIKRLEKFYYSIVAKSLYNNPFMYCKDLPGLIDQLARIFRANRDSKTIVFSAKMYYYYCRIHGRNVYGDIPIPVDRRNALLSLTSCIVKGCREGLRKCVLDLMSNKYRGIVIDAWKIVSIESCIPMYRLDSLTWLIAGQLLTRRVDPLSLYKYYCINHGYCRDELKKLFIELVRCR